MPLPRPQLRPHLRPHLRPLLIALAGALLVLVPAACDFPGPAVTVAFSSPTDGQRIVGSRTVTVSGVLHGVTPSTFSLTLNGKDVPIALPASGAFSTSVTLDRDGTNTLVATATASGETSMATLHLYYPFLSFTNGEAAKVVMGQTSFTATPTGAATQHNLDSPAGAPALVDGKLYMPDTGNNRVVGYNSVPTTTGALFDILLGQTTWFGDQPGTTTTGSSMTSPSGVAEGGGDLLVADTAHNRVLVYQRAPTVQNTAARWAVGQTSLIATTNSCDDVHLAGPRAAFVTPDGKLLVADTAHDRVLIWSTLPNANGAPADLVLGQSKLVTSNDVQYCQANRGAAQPSAGTLFTPSDIWSDGTRLVVADTGNHRVLIWTSFPTSNGQAADLVLGQATMTAATPADGTNGLTSPSSVTSNGNQLFVADTGNNRVLIWNTFPASSHAGANGVLGQADLTHTAANRGTGTDANTLAGPRGAQVYDGMLLVADTNNARELIYKP